ncbi:hypothetical protein R80B4_01092 [Fibrobacteres bacterium R8-0-B4]
MADALSAVANIVTKIITAAVDILDLLDWVEEGIYQWAYIGYRVNVWMDFVESVLLLTVVWLILYSIICLVRDAIKWIIKIMGKVGKQT